MALVAAEDRPPIEHDVHTHELPANPQRDYLIPATRWVEAPDVVLALGADVDAEVVAYIRRIGRYLLWRAGPPRHADAWYLAVNADDVTDAWRFRLFPDGSGDGNAPDGSHHTRFRTWKEALRAASDAAARGRRRE
jgi:hypothetical protein